MKIVISDKTISIEPEDGLDAWRDRASALERRRLVVYTAARLLAADIGRTQMGLFSVCDEMSDNNRTLRVRHACGLAVQLVDAATVAASDSVASGGEA